MQKLVFAQKMGRAMADVPLFGTDFNTWFPLTLVIYCLLLCALPYISASVALLFCAGMLCASLSGHSHIGRPNKQNIQSSRCQCMLEPQAQP